MSLSAQNMTALALCPHMISHSRIFEDVARAEAKAAKKAETAAKKAARPAKEAAPQIKNVAASTTLGDLDALAALKASMTEE